MILQGDALTMLRTLPSESIHMAITSPPYWNLRDYHVSGQLGLERSYDEYITKPCDVFDEVHRVLRPDGTCWVNLADSYSGTGGYKSPKMLNAKMRRLGHLNPGTPHSDIPRKSLCLIPYRFAIAMVRRGWILRNTIIWHKPSAIPESMKDRFTIDFEYLFLFSKSPQYAFQQQFEPATERGIRQGQAYVRNKRCVWSIPTQGFAGDHCAVYPEALVEVPIKAGCPVGGVVLDPFLGSGTTALVAERLNRRWIGIELNPAYVAMAEERLRATCVTTCRKRRREAVGAV
jgi:site-specific DNA-methyltransferase (cytosine-N4-specific)